MSFSITYQSIRTNSKGAFFTGFGLLLMAFLFAALHDQLKADLSSLLDVIPSGMEAFIGDLSVATTPEGWLSIELFALFVPLAFAILGLALGSKMIGKEEDSGTLELLLSRPISRHHIVAEKALALGIILALPAALLWLGVFIGSLLFPFDVNLMYVAQATISAWVFGLGFGMMTFAAQATSGNRGIAVALGAGFLGLTWALNIIAELVSSLGNLKYASPLHYFNNPQTLISGLDMLYVVVLIAIALLGYVLAHIGFANRDITS